MSATRRSRERRQNTNPQGSLSQDVTYTATRIVHREAACYFRARQACAALPVPLGTSRQAVGHRNAQFPVLTPPSAPPFAYDAGVGSGVRLPDLLDESDDSCLPPFSFPLIPKPRCKTFRSVPCSSLRRGAKLPATFQFRIEHVVINLMVTI